MSADSTTKTIYEKYRLKNGLDVYHLNQYETKFLYKEMFEEKIYFKHGISLENRSVVFDVGANIGLFTLSVKEQFPDSKVYAFEPSPDLFNILQLNAASYDSSIMISQVGLSDKKGKAVFTYYPKYSMLSGFHADSTQDEKMLLSGAYNQLQEPLLEGRLKRNVDSLIKDKLTGKKEFECSLTTISSIIKEHQVSHIDLLKIDAEKSEENILLGIEEDDWSKIRQIAIEIHDATGNLEKSIKGLLQSKGFEAHIEEELQFKGAGIFNIYAIRVKS